MLVGMVARRIPRLLVALGRDCQRFVVIGAVIGRFLDELQLGCGGPVGADQSPDVRLRQDYSGPLLHEANEGRHAHLPAAGTNDLDDLRRHLMGTLRTAPRWEHSCHAFSTQSPSQATDCVPVTTEGTGYRYIGSQLRSGEHRDTDSFRRLVIGLIDVDRQAAEAHRAFAVSVDQRQTPSDLTLSVLMHSE